MAMVQCSGPLKHLYDNKLYSSCPYCPSIKAPPRDVTQAQAAGATKGMSGDPGAGDLTIQMSPIDDNSTINPVVGWIVCVKGSNLGRDYRLQSGSNKIGRDAKWNVFIEGDNTISRDVNCAIVYDPRGNLFLITPGDASNLVYLNGEVLLETRPLKPYQTIEIGKSAFRFVPFCSDSFQWKGTEVKQQPTVPEELVQREPDKGTGDSLG